MAGKKAKRRKLARKAILQYVDQGLTDPYSFDTRATAHLSDHEFEKVCRQIRKARVVVKWDA